MVWFDEPFDEMDDGMFDGMIDGMSDGMFDGIFDGMSDGMFDGIFDGMVCSESARAAAASRWSQRRHQGRQAAAAAGTPSCPCRRRARLHTCFEKVGLLVCHSSHHCHPRLGGALQRDGGGGSMGADAGPELVAAVSRRKASTTERYAFATTGGPAQATFVHAHPRAGPSTSS